jgi:AcrR family transcriptional regulator
MTLDHRPAVMIDLTTAIDPTTIHRTTIHRTTIDPAGTDRWASLLPEGDRPPAEVPEAAFSAALTTLEHGGRIDMQQLATIAGISRSTLYRRVGGRDELVGACVWYLTRRALISALASCERFTGAERILCALSRFMEDVAGQPAVRQLLLSEPENALRILTSRDGPVQGRMVTVVARLLAEEVERGNLRTTIELQTLAYVIVRIAESFLYADVVAASSTDLPAAIAVIRRMLHDEADEAGETGEAGEAARPPRARRIAPPVGTVPIAPSGGTVPIAPPGGSSVSA